ncbi:PepSY-associated TM helix domain-containing protein [uncultured Lutibacter sp.]|uniref:PepSY-associated TM helix domain-containing protein n=1 Tax=uncultured Lutibacter sp. TaxID=437739 RepID=UPI00260FA063|nr:PepSY-associated TM helix domain-containing protein [uncultured Lutibacter sp.]
MKLLRKWSRILHRDVGFFFIGTTLIYAISGIALNHMADWNPNYKVEINHFTTSINLEKTASLENNILNLLDKIDSRDNYKSHYYSNPNTLKIFLKGGSSIYVNIKSGKGMAEYLKRRSVFYESNYLHYNPNRLWTWFSDIYAAALILFVVTSFFITKGKHGILGRGGIYTALGILIPILFLIYYM